MTSKSVPAPMMRITLPPLAIQLVVELAWALAWALAKGVVIIILAPNLFDNKNDDDDAIVSPLLPLPPLLSRHCVGLGVGC
jgi:hypothetical protein